MMQRLPFLLLFFTGLVQQLAVRAETITDFLRGRTDLSEFLMVLQRPGLQQAYLERQVTILVPTNEAMLEYRGNRGEELALNHLVNAVVTEGNLPGRLSSLVTGGPPIWVTRRSAWLYFNQARALERNIVLQMGGGEEQVVFVIDSVLEPLLPIQIKNATFTQDVTAGKLLEKSTLFNLGEEGATRIFFQRARLNKRERMFDVPGRHTFFLPIDSAFQNQEREFAPKQLTRYPPGIGYSELKQVVSKDFIDAKVIEAHIVPGQLLFTTLIPTQEYMTVAYDLQLPGVRVNVSLQPSLAAGGRVMVRSNTINGDRVHPQGMVVSRIVKGNIPVQNGIVHLIDKPLIVVAKTLYDYVMEEGAQMNNRLYMFAQLIKDKGGLFGETLLESKDGTLLAPSNEAMQKVDWARMNYILGHKALRDELFGLHFVRERISSNDPRIWRSGEAMYSAPASWATSRVWFQYQDATQTLSVEGRGVNASVLEKDIGTMNGVIHVIDRVLGVPHLSIADKMRSDPAMSHTWSLAVATRLSNLLATNNPNQRFTFVVPSNLAWEKVKRDFSQAFKSLTDISNTQYPMRILQRHMLIADRDFTIEQLVERSLRSPTTAIPTEAGALTFTAVGEIEFNAYKEWYISWGPPGSGIKGKVIRPNLECTNGYIHLVDTVMMDDRPLWAVEDDLASGAATLTIPVLVIIIMTIITMASHSVFATLT